LLKEATLRFVLAKLRSASILINPTPNPLPLEVPCDAKSYQRIWIQEPSSSTLPYSQGTGSAGLELHCSFRARFNSRRTSGRRVRAATFDLIAEEAHKSDSPRYMLLIERSLQIDAMKLTPRNLIARSCRLARVLIRVPETLTVERTELRCQVVRIASKGRLADWALRVCPFGQQNEMPARTQRKSPPGGVNSWEFRLFERSAVKGGVKVGHWGGVKGSQ
jgi:hypothetical protein